MYKIEQIFFGFPFQEKVFCFILFAIMMVLAMFGHVVNAGNKQEGERCEYGRNECASGLTCRRVGVPTAMLWVCQKT